MAGFSTDEHVRIERRLRETGRELFARYGLTKTTISELTDPAGIATSTFYRYYDSKEALYLEILEAEGEEIVTRVLGNSFETYDDPERAIRAFLERVMDEIETNPLVRRLILENELDELRASLTSEELAADRERSVEYFLPYLERWYEQERLTGPDPETIAHAIRAVTFVTLHREDIGENRYNAVRDTLVRSVAAGLTTEWEIDGAAPTDRTNSNKDSTDQRTDD